MVRDRSFRDYIRLTFTCALRPPRGSFVGFLFERGDRFAVLLDVQFAPGDHLGSNVKAFSPLIRDRDGLE
jgi:hypothetical protein